MNLIRSDIISLRGAVNSMNGGRPENQDDFDFLDTPLGFLCVVCDGMGGGPGGKTASYIAKYEMGMTLCHCNPETPRENALKMAVAKANEAIEDKMREVPSLNGMGSTLVAILISQDSAVIAHIGDSRCYQIRGKKCIYRSTDHSLVAQLVQRKALTEEEARVSPQANVITRGLGNVSNHVPDIDVVPYKKGDRFILCTDGVWGSMPHKDLLHRFIQRIAVQDLIISLSQEVDSIGFSRGGGHDNHTVALIEMEGSSIYKGTNNKKKIIIAIFVIVPFFVALVIFISFIFGSLVNKGNQSTETQSSIYCNGSENDVQMIQSSMRKDGESVYDINKDSVNTDQEIIESKLKMQRSKETSLVSNEETRQDSSISTSEMYDAKSITQQIIDRYKNAKDVAEPTPEEAQAKIEDIRKQVVELFEKLHEITNGDSIQYKVDACKRIANIEKNWWVNKTPDEKKQHRLTPANLKTTEKQIERLDSIKVKL